MAKTRSMLQKHIVEPTNAGISVARVVEIISEPETASAVINDTPVFAPVTDFTDFTTYSPEKILQLYNSCIKTAGQAQYLYTKLKSAEKSFGQLQLQCNENAAHIIAMQTEIEEQKIETTSIQAKLEGRDLQVLELEQQLKKVQESKSCADDRIEALALQITHYRDHFLTGAADFSTSAPHSTAPTAPSSSDEDWVTVNRKSKSTSATPSRNRDMQSGLSYKDKLMLNPFAPLLSINRKVGLKGKAPTTY